MPGAECCSDKIFLTHGIHSLEEKTEGRRGKPDKPTCSTPTVLFKAVMDHWCMLPQARGCSVIGAE